MDEHSVNIEITKLAHYYLRAYSVTKPSIKQSFKKCRFSASKEATDHYNLIWAVTSHKPGRDSGHLKLAGVFYIRCAARCLQKTSFRNY
jgi:hypothetical protein